MFAHSTRPVIMHTHINIHTQSIVTLISQLLCTATCPEPSLPLINFFSEFSDLLYKYSRGAWDSSGLAGMHVAPHIRRIIPSNWMQLSQLAKVACTAGVGSASLNHIIMLADVTTWKHWVFFFWTIASAGGAIADSHTVCGANWIMNVLMWLC